MKTKHDVNLSHSDVCVCVCVCVCVLSSTEEEVCLFTHFSCTSECEMSVEQYKKDNCVCVCCSKITSHLL